ncbi:leucyl/phenylalanyl-tRNA--protein transferase [Oceanobacter mangrovi]|uniref:leucyl/phenylalanyl-tRNA--protein transferase n=1 Tax=Oceanobacter mangrovi TaxID=2862510 RepID=UPI001C8E4CD3|nr:leucyl/phenylalanyl-tRNA--protein transferase [Oceanobacter mangrovi]
MIDWLDERSSPHFPATSRALNEPDGLLAVGGGLTPVWLHTSYRQGIFPWPSDGLRLWWTPAPRAVILAESFRIPRTIRKELRKTPYRFTANQAFKRVISSCAKTHDMAGGTWIEAEMLEQYNRMAKAGFALSVECWSPSGELIGGFYGIRIGSAYFGESMFSLAAGASKQAFAIAASQMFANGIQIIDCQMKTDHLDRFGLIELNRQDFEQHLHRATRTPLARPPLPAILNHFPEPASTTRASGL